MIHPRTLNSLEYEKISAWLADLCVSSIGRERARELTPLANAKAAENEFTLFEESRIWSQTARFTLSAFPDVRELLSAVRDNASGNEGIPRARFDLDAFWALREMLSQGKKARESITSGQSANMWPHLLAIAEDFPVPQTLEAALVRCISQDGQLRDESSPELARLREEARKIHQSCLRKVRDFAVQYNMLSLLQDEFMTISSDRYVLPLKANFKGRMQGIIHDWSQTGETCYFEPIFLVDLNNRLQELKHEEKEEERKILDYLGELLENEADGVTGSLNLLALVDFLNAKKLFADLLDCHCLSFTPDEEGISLLSARHPILALQRQKISSGAQSGKDQVRPLDIILRPGDRVLVITGGNAGGKTVCLKTLGLIAALAMSGLPVPVAAGSHLPWFDRLDAFIGDEQSLTDNVSTFTAQIDHLAKAWKYLDSSGLVLLDEFGAGTDPAEGAALAQAVLDELLEKKCFVLAATHFPSLKSYALSKAGVRAASMLFNPASHRPLYKIAYDQVGSSQALDVAEEYGLPLVILNRARHYLLQDGGDASAIIAKLNALAAERETEIENLRREEAKARNILNEKREKLDSERRRLREEVRAHASELMRAWKEGRATAKQSLREMSRLRAQIATEDRNTESSSVLPQIENFTTGQTVLHSIFNKRGIITDIDTRKKRARLDMNGVSLWAEMSDLRQVGNSNTGKTPLPKSSILNNPPENMVMSCDVRGLNGDEAEAEVMKFIDQAIIAGYEEVEIVHGRGTGALRRQLHDFLRNNPAVKQFSLAPEDRGGDGMTIVKLN